MEILLGVLIGIPVGAILLVVGIGIADSLFYFRSDN